MIEIDGDSFEGGGSILRVAVPLALALGETVRVYNIRKKRKKPGLKLQHLVGLELMRQIVDGKLEGGELDSQEIVLVPGSYRPRVHKIRIGTAGAITLVIQSVQNYVAASKNTVEVEFEGGGTHTSFSPTWEEARDVTGYYFRKFGIELQMELTRAGFYPKGGAMGRFKIRHVETPTNPVRLEKEQTSSPSLSIYSIASKSLRSASVAERQMKGFLSKLSSSSLYGLPRDENVEYVDSHPGTAFVAVYKGAYVKGYNALGAKGKRAETVGEEVALKLLKDWNIDAMDEHTGDQILVPLAFAPSGSLAKIWNTGHVQANLHVINRFLPDAFKVEGKEFLIVEKI